MPLDFIIFNGVEYPIWEAEGHASRWVLPLAKRVLKDHAHGVDIGYSKPEWQFPGSRGVEPSIDARYDAMNLPFYNPNDTNEKWDYLFASHSLEHIKENWVNVLDYWLSCIKTGGIIFLYLPHISQTYWNIYHNRKHVHQFTGDEIKDYLKGLGHKVFVSGCDYNHSFVVICEKVDNVKQLSKIIK